MHIKHASIRFNLLVRCAECGVHAEAETQTLDMHNCSRVELLEALNKQRVGTNHPVGWSSSYGTPDNEYHCPKHIK